MDIGSSEGKGSRIRTMEECAKEGKKVDVLLWVGCAGAYDERYGRVMRSLCWVLDQAKVSYAILGKEEGCTGDPARRAGNEFLFQMQAGQNIACLNKYKVKHILTSCPHCFHTLKHEYTSLGGDYTVMHHSTFLWELVQQGRLRIAKRSSSSATYHDSCYLARANGVSLAPRALLRALFSDLREISSCGTRGNCCGAGGAQMFKEREAGTQEVHHQRSQEALQTGAKTLASGCPFCLLMLRDGVTHHGKEKTHEVKDIVELLEKGLRGEDE